MTLDQVSGLFDAGEAFVEGTIAAVLVVLWVAVLGLHMARPLMAQTTAVSAPRRRRSSPICQAWPRWNGLYSLMIPAVRIKIISKWLQFWLLQKNLWLSSQKFLL